MSTLKTGVWYEFPMGWPDWGDASREIEVQLGSRGTFIGTLIVDDCFPDGEGDEFPIFVVENKQGAKISFVEADRWRFLN